MQRGRVCHLWSWVLHAAGWLVWMDSLCIQTAHPLDATASAAKVYVRTKGEIGMKKSEIAILEKAFNQEVEGALNNTTNIFRAKARWQKTSRTKDCFAMLQPSWIWPVCGAGERLRTDSRWTDALLHDSRQRCVRIGLTLRANFVRIATTGQHQSRAKNGPTQGCSVWSRVEWWS